MARKTAKVQKTNAMRELDAAGIAYEFQSYEVDEDVPSGELGTHIAAMLGEDPDAAFKTLVCVSSSGEHVVCCIPVDQELDLKKAAAASGQKNLSMLPVKELEGLTGYVRGGCTPVGMKRQFPTIIDETAQLFELIHISGGKRGLSLTLSPEDLASFVSATFADIVREVH